MMMKRMQLLILAIGCTMAIEAQGQLKAPAYETTAKEDIIAIIKYFIDILLCLSFCFVFKSFDKMFFCLVNR